MTELLFTIASTDDDFLQVERLNHDTFTSEIPQHAPRENGRLKDVFHDENTYIVCKDGPTLVGMLALRGRRPFSLDCKLSNLDALLPPHTSPCEIRLLAVRGHRRKGRVAAGLLAHAAKTLLRWGHDLVVVSATTRELPFYRSMGFADFGPPVGSVEASYQPMHLTYEAFTSVLRPRLERLFPRLFREPINFLPGPPTLSASVRRALAAPSLHHRSPEAIDLLRTTQAMLCELTGARGVQIAPGSGTSANDMVAAALGSFGGSGLVVSNGEFGERLADHARRAHLPHTHLAFEWGAAFDFAALSAHITHYGRPGWLWCVHGETSTGVLNPLSEVKDLCRQLETHLCVDAVSSLGVVPVDLSGCTFATGASAKGLGAVPGLALVFHDEPPAATPYAARSLDLSRSVGERGVPCTISSMLLAALRAGLQQLQVSARADEIRESNFWLRRTLPALDLRVISDAHHSFDAVLTLEVPAHIDSRQLGASLARAGFEVGHESEYLQKRNWIQVCFMSAEATQHVPPLYTALRECVARTDEVELLDARPHVRRADTLSGQAAAPPS